VRTPEADEDGIEGPDDRVVIVVGLLPLCRHDFRVGRFGRRCGDSAAWSVLERPRCTGAGLRGLPRCRGRRYRGGLVLKTQPEKQHVAHLAVVVWCPTGPLLHVGRSTEKPAQTWSSGFEHEQRPTVLANV